MFVEKLVEEWGGGVTGPFKQEPSSESAQLAQEIISCFWSTPFQMASFLLIQMCFIACKNVVLFIFFFMQCWIIVFMSNIIVFHTAALNYYCLKISFLNI